MCMHVSKCVPTSQSSVVATVKHCLPNPVTCVCPQLCILQVEVAVEGGKRLLTADKGLAPDAAGRAPPPLTVASLCLKTSIHPTSHQHEVSVCVCVCVCVLKSTRKT